MQSTAKHLVFYDGTCGLCDRAVYFILRHDPYERFSFAKLSGATAKTKLANLPRKFKSPDSLVLIENYETEAPSYYVLSKAVFRIFWLLGGVWTFPGLLYWTPSFLYDWGYRFVAKHRHTLLTDVACIIPTKEIQHRFLP